METIDSLRSHSKKIVILNQPPILPKNANRAAIRNGLRPPFVENLATRESRKATNTSLLKVASKNVQIVDISRVFEKTEDGDIRFFDPRSNQLYHDSTHLSGHGADLVKPIIRKALIQ